MEIFGGGAGGHHIETRERGTLWVRTDAWAVGFPGLEKGVGGSTGRVGLRFVSDSGHRVEQHFCGPACPRERPL